MHLLFDLDGTLTDPFPGITKCIQHALVSLGRPPPSAESLRWCIGPPLKKSFATLLGSEDEHTADAALTKYRERFGMVGLFENAVYPEIETALDELRKAGYSLGVATSKPTVFAERIIEHFGLRRYFRAVDGSELDGTSITMLGRIMKFWLKILTATGTASDPPNQPRLDRVQHLLPRNTRSFF